MTLIWICFQLTKHKLIKKMQLTIISQAFSALLFWLSILNQVKLSCVALGITLI